MSKSNRSSSRSKKKSKLQRKVNDFSRSVGLSPLKIIVSALLLLVVGFVIFFVAFSDRGDEKIVKTVTGLKLQQQELDVDKQLTAMLEKRVPPNQDFLTTIDDVSKMNDSLESIESSHELSEAQMFLVERIKLRNKSVVVMLMIQNKVSCDTERADFFRYGQQQLDSKNPENQQAAKYWLCLIPTVELTKTPSDETMQNFVTALEAYPGGYVESPKYAGMLSSLMLKMSKDSRNAEKYWTEGFDVLSNQLAKSENEQVLKIGQRLQGLKMFVKFNLSTLADRILWSDPTGPRDLEGAIQVLAEHPQSDLANWVTIIKAYESFLSTDKIEETGSAWQKVSELSKGIADADKKKEIDAILTRQRQRAMAIGTKFDPSGTLSPDGRPIQLDEKDYTAVMFCDKTTASFKALIALGSEAKERNLRYNPLIVFEQELTEVDIASLDKVPNGILIVDHATAKRYFNALPIDFFPYILLLDKDGTIVSANLDVQQIPTRVARFSADQRKKQEGTETPAP